MSFQKDSNRFKLANLAGLNHWGFSHGTGTEGKVYKILKNGYLYSPAIKYEKLIDGTYKNWSEMMVDGSHRLEEALELTRKTGSLVYRCDLLANFSEVPPEVVCLDFDDCNAQLPKEWSFLLEMAAVEVSSSGKGLHAFFKIPTEMSSKFKGDYIKHREFGFKLQSKADNSDGVGIDCFVGGVNRVVKVTGDALNDWQTMVELPELKGQNLEFLDKCFKAKGFYQIQEPDEAKYNGKVSGYMNQAVGIEAQAIESMGAGVENSSEVIRLMRQHNYFLGVNGGLVQLLDGNAEFINTHFGDWSAADAAACLEASYYTRKAEVIAEAISGTKLAARGAGYTGKNPTKWSREDYIKRTVDYALQARIKKGNTYQAAQEVKERNRAEGQSRLEEWPEELRKELELDNNLRPKATLMNAVRFLTLHHDFKGVIGWNDLSNRTEVKRVPHWSKGRALCQGTLNRDGMGAILTRLCFLGCNITRQTLESALSTVAEQQVFNPLADKLNALKWDGTPRLEKAASTYLNLDKGYSKREREIVNMMFKLSLIAAVRRGMSSPNEQIKSDTMLILLGGPGVRKSTAVKILGEACGGEFYTDSLPSLNEDTREFQRAIRGLWFAEVAEMASLLQGRGGTEVVKHVLSASEDRFRENYNEHNSSHRRTCSFIGTFNPNGLGFIRDYALCRRFWPIKVGGTIDTEGLLSIREQLFAEAVYLAKEGVEHYFSKPEDIEVQEKLVSEFYRANVLVDDVEKYLSSRGQHGYVFSTKDVYDHFTMSGENKLLNLTGKRSYAQVEYFICDALQQLGYESFTETTGTGILKRSKTLWRRVDTCSFSEMIRDLKKAT
ncbi:VapE domain-containing protein [Neisseria sp. CCUG17229]|uniref:VapE domain-containing protein n=1 Tax=Neisseria sp. CCUG17229 TaxID=3392036 RepID=UPI003A10090A